MYLDQWINQIVELSAEKLSNFKNKHKSLWPGVKLHFMQQFCLFISVEETRQESILTLQFMDKNAIEIIYNCSMFWLKNPQNVKLNAQK